MKLLSFFYGRSKDIKRQKDEDLFAWAARTYQPYCKGKTRLFLFSEWLPGSPSTLEQRTRFWADVTRKHGFDGIDVHEAWNFESNPANMPLLGAMAERLQGKTQQP